VTDSAFRSTLLRWADADDPIERRRVAGLLASQIELALNQQGNNAQIVIWDVQEKTDEKIDSLHEQVGNTNVLISGVIEALNGLRDAVQDGTARLGKLEAGQAKLERGQGRLSTKMRESIADRADLRRLANEQRQMIVELAERFNNVVGTMTDHEQRLVDLEDSRGDHDSVEA
jgi:chromosome segregation ATPase